ncbi:MAG TPA: hypothetical protein DHU59_07765 [Clostridiales bacterium]|nr:hypothetical protein [Clostridiales bacterium]
MNFTFKLFLTLNSTSTMIIVYLIKERYYLLFLKKSPVWISYIIFLLIPFLLTIISLWMKRFLSQDDINCELLNVEEANNTFLPSYLGYFFVALGVELTETMIFIYIIVFIFTYLSQTLYYNPLFLLLGYKFYYITTVNNVKLFIISKKEINTTKGIKFPRLRRINNTTFIDEEE